MVEVSLNNTSQKSAFKQSDVDLINEDGEVKEKL